MNLATIRTAVAALAVTATVLMPAAASHTLASSAAVSDIAATRPVSRTHSDLRVGYTIRYPQDWKVRAYPDGVTSIVAADQKTKVEIVLPAAATIEEAIATTVPPDIWRSARGRTHGSAIETFVTAPLPPEFVPLDQTLTINGLDARLLGLPARDGSSEVLAYFVQLAETRVVLIRVYGEARAAGTIVSSFAPLTGTGTVKVGW